MKPCPRIRKIAKWGGLVAAILLVVLWVFSGRYDARVSSPNGVSASIWRGGIYVMQSRKMQSRSPDWKWSLRDDPKPYWWKLSCDSVYAGWFFNVPFWIPFAFVIGAIVSAWCPEVRVFCRTKLGYCPECGYGRDGLSKDAPCPECGRA